MAHSRTTAEGNYASPQSSRSGSVSELGLTLPPSNQSGVPRESLDYAKLRAIQNGGPHPFEDLSVGHSYPSPTSTEGSFQLEYSHDLPKHQVNVPNGGPFKQSLSTITDNQSNTIPLFVHLRSVDRHGRVSGEKVRSTSITPRLYRPSAPHLHAIVSTGITLAAAAQLDHLKERNKRLTMERDRFYHLSKPATRRADDGKTQQIRDLRAELKAFEEQNRKLGWALENQTARAKDAVAFAASQKAHYEALQAAYNMLVTGNTFLAADQSNQTPVLSTPLGTNVQRLSSCIDLTSPKQASFSQQGELREHTFSSATDMPVTMVEDRPLVADNGTPKHPSSSATAVSAVTTDKGPPAPGKGSPKRTFSAAAFVPATPTEEQVPNPLDWSVKRQRKDKDTGKQPRRQYSMLNGSQMSSIQARLRQELKGKTASYAWANEDGTKQEEKNEMGKGGKVEAAIGVDIAREEAGDELSESEIAAFDRALEEASDDEREKKGDEDGDGDSLFGGG